MADDPKSLKDWKTYYKNRYKKTGRKIYKRKLEELKRRTEDNYSFEYDPAEFDFRGPLERAERLVKKWKELKFVPDTNINFVQLMRIFNKYDSGLPVRGISSNGITVQIKFGDSFILDFKDRKWQLYDEPTF